MRPPAGVALFLCWRSVAMEAQFQFADYFFFVRPGALDDGHKSNPGLSRRYRRPCLPRAKLGAVTMGRWVFRRHRGAGCWFGIPAVGVPSNFFVR